MRRWFGESWLGLKEILGKVFRQIVTHWSCHLRSTRSNLFSWFKTLQILCPKTKQLTSYKLSEICNFIFYFLFFVFNVINLASLALQQHLGHDSTAAQCIEFTLQPLHCSVLYPLTYFISVPLFLPFKTKPNQVAKDLEEKIRGLVIRWLALTSLCSSYSHSLTL